LTFGWGIVIFILSFRHKAKTKEKHMNIVKTIKAQLFMTKQDAMKVWSWGAHRWVQKDKYTLAFKVNAHRFSGFISITLNANDLYEITFFKNKTLKGLINNPEQSIDFEKIDDVYFDQLVEIIDDKIEKLSSYHY